jgi:hypothetical protein
MTTISEINEAVIQQTVSPVTTYLKPNSFKFQISRAPNVTYTCQSANLPSVQIGSAQQISPFVDIPHPGDKVTFGEFTIRFLINEDMSNYKELYNWLTSMGAPYNGEQWGQAKNNPVSAFIGENYNNVFSDGQLLILNSNNIPTVRLSFQDLFPISVEGLDFDITTAGMEYFVGVASFRYKLFTIESLTV